MPVPFFEDPEEPDPSEAFPRREPREWDRPHPGRLGGLVPLRLVLARTAEHIVLLGPMEAHPKGVVINLEVRSRRPDFEPMGWHDSTGGELRFGIEFSDGRSTELSRRFWERMNDPGDGPLLLPGGGGGGGGVYHHNYWLWPLPPPGEMHFHLQWADAGIEETSVSVDASVFLDAANSAETLWDPLTPEEEREAMRAMQRRMHSSGSSFTVGSIAFASEGEGTAAEDPESDGGSQPVDL